MNSSSSKNGVLNDYALPTQGGHRALNEDVLQSSPEALGVGVGENRADNQTFISNSLADLNDISDDATLAAHDEPASLWASEDSFLARAQDRVEDFVVDEPFKSGLIALGFGALAALLVSRTLRSRLMQN